jgi:hypothetical protein
VTYKYGDIGLAPIVVALSLLILAVLTGIQLVRTGHGDAAIGLGFVSLAAIGFGGWASWTTYEYAIEDAGLREKVVPKSLSLISPADRLVPWLQIVSFAFVHAYKGERVIKIDLTDRRTLTIPDRPGYARKGRFDSFAEALSGKFASLQLERGVPKRRPSFWSTTSGVIAASAMVLLSWTLVAALYLYGPTRNGGFVVVSILMTIGCWSLIRRKPWK